MSLHDRDIEILVKMIRYCNEIEAARERFGDSFAALASDTDYKNATAMCILQIGELTTHLSNEFKNKYSAQPWQDINGMRNVAAHHYGKFDVEILWKTISVKIPEFKRYCQKCFEEINACK